MEEEARFLFSIFEMLLGYSKHITQLGVSLKHLSASEMQRLSNIPMCLLAPAMNATQELAFLLQEIK